MAGRPPKSQQARQGGRAAGAAGTEPGSRCGEPKGRRRPPYFYPEGSGGRGGRGLEQVARGKAHKGGGLGSAHKGLHGPRSGHGPGSNYVRLTRKAGGMRVGVQAGQGPEGGEGAG